MEKLWWGLGVAALLVGGTAPASVHVRVPFVSKASQVTKRKQMLGDWRLEIVKGKFSGDIACHLRSKNKRVFYVTDALAFRFGKRLDTLSAWIRLDGGEAYRWRDDLPELARLGVAIDGRNLDAPTDGIVSIPAAKLTEVNRVQIQPRPDKRARTYHLRGFTGLREIARTMGCAPETRFIR